MLDESALDQQLRTARASLHELQASVQAAAPPEPVTVERANGLISVTVGPDGRLTSLDAHPAVLREGVEFVTGEIMAAVNAALDAQAPEVPVGAVPDIATLFATVERAQDEGLRQMRQITTTIGEAMRRIAPEGR
ncbi:MULTISPECIES: YbaB/EbfC family nucleoid-associated protein [Catenuloplanes]|uniref:DNA-binding protein YbaB n=1 Tax=Catenuloplanes niger TaxID=587534 RepID=A0AAE4CWW1_9ACTN|nr:YbaB/EbfC family nucleoid-associated protein [Catenuloplanes niger]MDR7327610.1 DNA-binding protein YbaB [Catenuloplanes niger]